MAGEPQVTGLHQSTGVGPDRGRVAGVISVAGTPPSPPGRHLVSQSQAAPSQGLGYTAVDVGVRHQTPCPCPGDT